MSLKPSETEDSGLRIALRCHGRQAGRLPRLAAMSYEELIEFCGGNEAQAAVLAKWIPYRELDLAELNEQVTELLCRIYERGHHGQFRLEYLGGSRRGTLRS